MFKAGLFGVLSLFIASVFISCDSENNASDPSPSVSQSDKKAEVLKMLPSVIQNLPKIKIVHGEAGKQKDGGKDGGFNFGSSGSFDFSSPSGNTYTTEEGVVIISTPSFGANAGGGVISAGSSTFDITATFCLSAGEEGEGSELSDLFAGGLDGVSLVIGISGDLELSSIDTTSFLGGIEAMAIYVVFDDEAQGSYDVFNFFDFDEDDDSFDPTGSAYAYILDIKEGRFFISSDGSLNVSGGNITFDGEYLQLDLSPEDFFEEGEGEDIDDFEIVSGSGTMGC